MSVTVNDKVSEDKGYVIFDLKEWAKAQMALPIIFL